MKKYRVFSERYTSKDFTNLEEAVKEYGNIKDKEINDEPDQDTYVELIMSTDDFEDSVTIRKAVLVEDEELMSKTPPKELGRDDIDYWVKWQETI